jgi:hypothetical protein
MSLMYYMLPHSCVLVLIKLVCIGHVCGMCALVGAILYLVWGSDSNL